MSEHRLPTASERRAEKIVDALEHRFRVCHRMIEEDLLVGWDHDQARRLIATLIRQTEEEIERLTAENAELRKRPDMTAGYLDVEEFYEEEESSDE